MVICLNILPYHNNEIFVLLYSKSYHIVQDDLFLMLFCDDIERQQLKWRNQDVLVSPL